MTYDLIIKNATVVTAADQFEADIAVKGGTIAALGKNLQGTAAKTVDAKGLYVLPGGIDVHTHLDMPFGGTTTADNFETGTTAAACGGTTTIVDFAIQYKGEDLQKGLDTWHKKASGNSAIDYAFHMIITDMPQAKLKQMDKLVDEGISSFKLFMAYPGVFMSDDTTIFRALMRTKENGGMVCMHAENGSVIDVLVQKALAEGKTHPKYHALTRPMSAEAEATRRAIALAEMAGVPIYFVHLSAGDAMEEVRRARERGLPIYAETCPQYLYLSYEDYERPGFEGAKFVMSPPLRPKGNEERLWNGLRNNWLQVVSTDHCSFCFQSKDGKPGKELGKNDFSKIPNGAPGIETRLLLLWEGVENGQLTMNRFVDITATTPAKLFGLYPKKGTIAPGADADLVLWDPKQKTTISAKTHHMNVDYNPYEGQVIRGAIREVYLRGKKVVEKGSYVGGQKTGSFLERATRPEKPVESAEAQKKSTRKVLAEV
ncbi:MAG: dihydropyrimidinase [Elusimicrobia bacterium]|nr:dihydropyrimidinase [Elusimicrobiota bacterium]